MKKNAARIEVWVWPLIYGGLLLGALGLAVRLGNAMFGWSAVALGGVAVAAGVVLIYVRSRMDGTNGESP